jgi:hypothetical protein
MFAKKFPLNIFVGSNMNLSNKKLKVYHGKYIRTFIVNNSMKRDLTSKTENKNPYEEKIKGNYIYFEEQQKKLFKKRKSTRSPLKPNTNKKVVILPKIVTPKLDIVNEAPSVRLEDKHDSLNFLQKMYGLKHIKPYKTFEEDGISKTKRSSEFLINNNSKMIQSRTEPSLQSSKLGKSTLHSTSYFKNDEFYYFNTNV